MKTVINKIDPCMDIRLLSLTNTNPHYKDTAWTNNIHGILNFKNSTSDQL